MHVGRILSLGTFILAATFVAPPAAPALLFETHSGPVQTHPAVFGIFWGNAWNTGPPSAERSRLSTMYHELSGSSWQGILTQYWEPQAPQYKREGTAFAFVSPNVTVGGFYTDSEGPPSGVTQAQMEAEVKKAIEAKNGSEGWPKSPSETTLDDQFVIFTPAGTTWGPDSNSNACGDHRRTFTGSNSYTFSRVVTEPAKCGLVYTAAHEYAESVTDPSSQEGWKYWQSESHAEIADYCDNGSWGELPGGIIVPGIWDNQADNCSGSDANPPQIAPEILTEGATSVTATSALLHGSKVNNGIPLQFGRFKWSTAAGWEGSETYSHQTEMKEFFYGGTTAAGISGLKPGTTYHYQLEIYSNVFPTYFMTGEDHEFRTAGAPVVTTEAATRTNSFEPQLNAKVNPEGADTHYQFEYGPTEAYGFKSPVTAEDIGSGLEAVRVSQTLAGLEPNKLYHFRITASNEAGTTKGSDMTFTTLALCKGGGKECTWSAQSVASPNPPPNRSLRATSCPTATMCMAAGTDAVSGKSFGSVWNGSSWSVAIENANTIPASAIACDSATSCMTVGTVGSSAVSQRWLYGFESWTPLGAAIATPAGATSTKLTDVSCTSASACTAVGAYYKESRWRTMAERWNGSAWSLQETPNPESGNAELNGVSCDSSASCTAVGVQGKAPYAMSWNGTSWSVKSIPTPSGATQTTFQDVSCPAAGSCMAVGWFFDGGSYKKPLAERWNGTAWSLAQPLTPAEASGNVTLSGVSCVAAAECIAVGSYATQSESFIELKAKTLAEHWDGSAWALQSSPNASGKDKSALAAVSCSAATACTAVGSAGTQVSKEESVTFGARYE